jgi:hypothetical protein
MLGRDPESTARHGSPGAVLIEALAATGLQIRE